MSTFDVQDIPKEELERLNDLAPLLEKRGLEEFVKKLEEAGEYAEKKDVKDFYGELIKEMKKLDKIFAKVREGKKTLDQNFWINVGITKKVENALKVRLVKDCKNIIEFYEVIRNGGFGKDVYRRFLKALVEKDATQLPRDFSLRSTFIEITRRDKENSYKLVRELYDTYRLGMEYVTKLREHSSGRGIVVGIDDARVLDKKSIEDLWDYVRNNVLGKEDIKFFMIIRKKGKVYEVNFWWFGEGGFIIRKGDKFYYPLVFHRGNYWELNTALIKFGSRIKRKLDERSGLVIFDVGRRRVDTTYAVGFAKAFPQELASYDPPYNAILFQYKGKFDEIIVYDNNVVRKFLKQMKGEGFDIGEFFSFASKIPLFFAKVI